MPVIFSDLEAALMAGDAAPGACAWINELTSEVRMSFDESEKGGPPPEDEVGWRIMPNARELNLKQRLVWDFVADECPEMSDQINRCFSRRGAWQAFKHLLARRNLLDRWHRYQEIATRHALLTWAA